MLSADPDDAPSRPWAGLGSIGCALSVLAGVVLEMLAGQAANSPEPDWVERLVPLAWPRPARVGWWLLIAAAAGAHRLLWDRCAGRSLRWVVAAVFAAPFLVFAGGIGAGASWATFH